MDWASDDQTFSETGDDTVHHAGQENRLAESPPQADRTAKKSSYYHACEDTIPRDWQKSAIGVGFGHAPS
jgi:hypothetical protein